MSKSPWRHPSSPPKRVKVALLRNFEFKLPLAWLLATPVASAAVNAGGRATTPVATLLRLRFSVWQNRLPGGRAPARRMDRATPPE